MSRPVSLIPTYRRHKQSGRAIITVRDHLDGRRDVLLPGAYRSKESLAEYDRICAVLRANNGRLPATKGGTIDLTVAELVLRYLDDFAVGYYVDPVTRAPTSEQHCLALAFRPLTRLFGKLSVVDFDSLKLEAVQAAMARGDWMNGSCLLCTSRATRVLMRGTGGRYRQGLQENLDYRENWRSCCAGDFLR